MNILLKNGFVGGLIVFLWGAASWMVLPFHAKAMHHFVDEASVQRTMLTNSPRAGIYILPHPEPENAKLKDPLAQQMAQVRKHQMEHGPFVFAVVQPRGTGPLLGLLLREAAIQVLCAILMTWLLLQLGPISYRRRVFFVMVVAMLGAMLVNLQQWNWWVFPDEYVLLQMLDLLIGWFLAGLVLAKWVPSVQSRS